MAQSFLSYIVRQHGLTFEDVATDALTYILRNSSCARDALRALLNSWAPVLPEHFSIDTRTSTENCGIPDLMFVGADDVPRVIIEVEFTARLTRHQPDSYLKHLSVSAHKGKPSMLVFLVPESRKTHYLVKLRESCSVLETRWEADEGCMSRLFIRIVTWQELLKSMIAVEADSDLAIFVQDLKRMCDAAEPDKFEEITTEEIAVIGEADGYLATRFRNLLSLASEVARRGFRDSLKDHSKYGEAWGSTWCGIYGRIADVQAWIGVDTSVWSKYGISPIWLELEDDKGMSKLADKLKILGENKGYFLRLEDSQIAIPISLSLGLVTKCLRDAVNKLRMCGCYLPKNS